MTASFDYYIIFAEMRTGSNFLETNLNAMSGVHCYGEAFNPHFIGYPNKTEILGITQAMRDADPLRLIGAIRDNPGEMAGFRYFHDHDPRVLDIALKDRRCAKIILTRNPLESYVSWKIAQETGQWKLTDVKRRRDAQVKFEPEEFTRHVEALQDFQVLLLNQLQKLGQTAFYLAYEDLQDLAVMNGLADWLELETQLDSLDKSLKPQNPRPITAKVRNPDEMLSSLSGLDRFNLSRTPNFEPRRGPVVPSYVVAAQAPLLYLPIRGGPETEVVQWMAALDGVDPDALESGLNQKQLRKWKRENPGHRSFTVLRHPLARAHAVFCSKILGMKAGSYKQIREKLRKQFKVPIPKDEPDDRYTLTDHRAAFEGFLEFVRVNLAGQTGIRVEPSWGTQSQAMSGFGDFAPPDFVIRESELETMLPIIANAIGRDGISVPETAAPDTPYELHEIYDDQLEKLAADIYQRDYMMFGFGPWQSA
ncbi:sulfotransferase family 2 domain-containing protein [Phaeobacter marinintestinus]|uniref:sulfotransferase family 2 domain-containing protein n=1 Tax=Falsiphaeobacter marinintestinus TaxID=1492905 RepID=UPI0011B7E1A5|nr:sulfotransferase family 2 domain-containing protein [Phaeobacter marinintestinus]